MRKIFSFILSAAVLLGCCALTSCHDNRDGMIDSMLFKDKMVESKKDLTILVYHPYVSDMTGILASDYADIIEAAQAAGGMQNVQLLHFSAPRAQTAYLIETKISPLTKEAKNDTLRIYSFPETDYTRIAGLQEVMADVKRAKKADKLGMIIGSHANGWIPAQKAPAKKSFGSGNDVTYKTNFTTLAEAITNNALRLEFLVIDDCNSQNIENAYDLRNAARYILASATEIMMEGMPYLEAFHLLANLKYDLFCDEFIRFYSDYSAPYATFSIVDCAQFDGVVDIMKRINSQYSFDFSKTANIQTFGGSSYRTPQFYDLQDYVENLCPDKELTAEFARRLSSLVPKYGNTPEFYWAAKDRTGYGPSEPVRTFCGITCSDPCLSLQSQLKETAWYKATHP